MGDQFVETSLIECNRQTSEEYNNIDDKTKPQSTWTNCFRDMYHFKAGDKISVYSAFISEKGAGQPDTIELKGKDLGITKSFKYLKKSRQNVAFGLIYEIDYEEVVEDIPLKDNEANMVINYYKNMNGTGYIALPRKFLGEIQKSSYADAVVVYGDNDIADLGFINRTPFIDKGSGVALKCQIKGDTYAYSYSTSKETKLRNDNTKYTIFVRKNVRNFTTEGVNASYNYSVAPEGLDYFLYREKKTISLPRGVNSATYIANEVSRQLSKVTEERDVVFRLDATKTEQENDKRDYSITKIVESETYKTFSTATQFFFTEANYDSAKVGGTGQWLNNYNTIAVKRPELWETGRKINITYRTEPLESDPSATTLKDFDGGIGGTLIHSDYSNTNLEPLILDMIWSKENLEKWKDFINAQELYPEMWESWTDTNKEYELYNSSNTFENTRFCHINQPYSNTNLAEINLGTIPFPLSVWRDQFVPLGNSFYRPNVGVMADNLRKSMLLLFKYEDKTRDQYFDPDQNHYDLSSGGYKQISPDINLTYGCFYPVKKYYLDGSFNYLVSIIVRDDAQNLTPPPTYILNADGKIKSKTKIGFDYHWTALGNCAITLFNGLNVYPNYTGTTFNMKSPENGSQQYNQIGEDPLDIGKYQHVRYVGADSPSLAYDGSHFFFSNFHTAENRGNLFRNNALGMPTTAFSKETNAPVIEPIDSTIQGEANPTPNDIIYKINPQQDTNELCPALLPYQPILTLYTKNGSSDPVEFESFNYQYQPWAIFDSKSGIFVEDFGYTEDTWEEGLFGLMGFRYSQFSEDNPNNRNKRIDSKNVNQLRYMTTNADITGGDTKTFNVNNNSVPLFTDNIPSGFTYFRYNKNGAEFNASEREFFRFPPIISKTQSNKIFAEEFPTSMIRSYYTIRSDIITDNLFGGGGHNSTNMPIVGIVDKMNPQNDFYFGSESSVAFTLNKDYRTSSIRVSIHDPDGTFSNLSNDSSVIFKVERPRVLYTNIAEQILLQQQKGKKNQKL